MLSEINQTKKKKPTKPSMILLEMLKSSQKSQKQEVEHWLPGLWGGKLGSSFFMGVEFQLYKMKRVLGIVGGDNCITL